MACISREIIKLSVRDDSKVLSEITEVDSTKDFVDGYENPISWCKKYALGKDQKITNATGSWDYRIIGYAQYGEHGLDYPENIKWKLFVHYIISCYEFISNKKPEKALEIIGEIENILLSIGNNNTFLTSIKIALNHITFSMKGLVLNLCSLETTYLQNFIMPNNMNDVNKAGLFGVQSLFFCDFGLSCLHIAKESAQKAISLNKTEAEWYFLLAKALILEKETSGRYFECSEQEIHASKKTNELGNKNHYKLQLSLIYYRMSRNMKDPDTKRKTLDDALELLNEIIMNTNDLFSLKNCLLTLSKFGKNNDRNDFSEMSEKLIDKLRSSDIGYIHGAIGHYYLYNKMDYEKANFHLKKAFDGKSFAFSMDYVYTLYKINPKTAPIEQTFVDMLKKFSHPLIQIKILSQIVSYLILTKNDFIQSLQYIPELLKTKNRTCINILMKHRVKCSPHYKEVNLLEVISNELDAALKDPASLTVHEKRITEVQQILGPYIFHVNSLLGKKEQIFSNNFKRSSKTENNISPFNHNNDYQNVLPPKNHIQGITTKKNRFKENWRTLKPDTNSNSYGVLDFKKKH